MPDITVSVEHLARHFRAPTRLAGLKAAVRSLFRRFVLMG